MAVRTLTNRAKGIKNQAVNYAKHSVPGGYAPNQGSGRPGRARTNQIRNAIFQRARVHKATVLPQRVPAGPQGTHSPSPHTRGMPPLKGSEHIHPTGGGHTIRAGAPSRTDTASRPGRNSKRARISFKRSVY